MPPLECANFLECENKTVCVAPFDLPHGSNTSFFHHIPENYHNSPCWAFFFGQYGLECDSMWNYRRLTRKLHLRHIPENVIPGDFSQKKTEPKKKTEKKRKSPSTKILWSAKILPSAWILQYSMCTSLAVERDALAGVRRICGMRRIPSMRGWYRDQIGKFRGQNQNSNPKAGPNFQGHTSGFYFSEFTLGEVPGKKLANFYSANL